MAVLRFWVGRGAPNLLSFAMSTSNLILNAPLGLDFEAPSNSLCPLSLSCSCDRGLLTQRLTGSQTSKF